MRKTPKSVEMLKTEEKSYSVIEHIHGYALHVLQPENGNEHVKTYSVRLTEAVKNGATIPVARENRKKFIAHFENMAKGKKDIFGIEAYSRGYVSENMVGIGKKEKFNLYPDELSTFVSSTDTKEEVELIIDKDAKDFVREVNAVAKHGDEVFQSIIAWHKLGRNFTQFIVEVVAVNARLISSIEHDFIPEIAEKSELMVQTYLYYRALEHYKANKKLLQPPMRYFHGMIGKFNRNSGQLEYELIFHLPFGKTTIVKQTVLTDFGLDEQ